MGCDEMKKLILIILFFGVFSNLNGVRIYIEDILYNREFQEDAMVGIAMGYLGGKIMDLFLEKKVIYTYHKYDSIKDTWYLEQEIRIERNPEHLGLKLLGSALFSILVTNIYIKPDTMEMKGLTFGFNVYFYCEIFYYIWRMKRR